MATKPATCECSASAHAVNGVKARGLDMLVCGAEIEPKHVKCRPCTKGNHDRIVCEWYVPIPTAAHLDRRCARCGFDSAKHPTPVEMGGRAPVAIEHVVSYPAEMAEAIVADSAASNELVAAALEPWSQRPDGAWAFDVTAAEAAAVTAGPVTPAEAVTKMTFGHVTPDRLWRWVARMLPARPMVLPPLPPPRDEREVIDDVADIELATGRQVQGVEPVGMSATLVEGRRPCQRCKRPTGDLPSFPSRAREWEFTRCPRCHRSTIHRIEEAQVA